MVEEKNKKRDWILLGLVLALCFSIFMMVFLMSRQDVQLIGEIKGFEVGDGLVCKVTLGDGTVMVAHGARACTRLETGKCLYSYRDNFYGDRHKVEECPKEGS